MGTQVPLEPQARQVLRVQQVLLEIQEWQGLPVPRVQQAPRVQMEPWVLRVQLERRVLREAQVQRERQGRPDQPDRQEIRVLVWFLRVRGMLVRRTMQWTL